MAKTSLRSFFSKEAGAASDVDLVPRRKLWAELAGQVLKEAVAVMKRNYTLYLDDIYKSIDKIEKYTDSDVKTRDRINEGGYSVP